MSTPGLGGGLGSLPTNWIQFHEFRGASLRSAEINVRRQTQNIMDAVRSFEIFCTDFVLLSSNSFIIFIDLCEFSFRARFETSLLKLKMPGQNA